jgi:hypothetical protein
MAASPLWDARELVRWQPDRSRQRCAHSGHSARGRRPGDLRRSAGGSHRQRWSALPGLGRAVLSIRIFHLSFLLPESPAISFLLSLAAHARGLALGDRVLVAHRAHWACNWNRLYLAAEPSAGDRRRPCPLVFAGAARSTCRPRITRAPSGSCGCPAVHRPLGPALEERRRVNIVSFGGFTTSGMAGFMLTPDVVDRLPDAVRLTAQAVLAARTAAEDAGRIARTPLRWGALVRVGRARLFRYLCA